MDSDVKSSSMETDNMTDSVDFPPIPDITDITLKVETTLIHVNKGVLMVASPVFKTMFTSNFMESGQTVITLPEKKAKDMRIFLKCIYPDRDYILTDEAVDAVLPLASEYMTTALLQKCERYLVQKYFNENNQKPTIQNLEMFLKFTKYGAMYDLKQLLTKSVQTLSEFSSASLEYNRIYNELPGDIKANIATQRVKKLESAMGNAKAAFYKFCSMKSTCEKCCEPGPKKMCLRDVSSWRAVENLSTVCPRCEAVQSLARPFKEVESKVKELSIVNYSGDTHNRY